MKHFFPVLFLMLMIAQARSQDTICFVSKEVKAVKVSEVGINEIKYHRFDNLDGPSYIVNKSDIKYIRYANGHIDSFAVAAPKVETYTQQPVSTYNPNASSGTIRIKGSKLIYQGKGVGETRLLKLITTYPEPQKKNQMLREFAEMKLYKRKQYMYGFGGLGVGIAAPIIGLAGSTASNRAAPFFGGVLIGTAVGVTGAVVSAINKKKRLKKMVDIANIYNAN